ncbi:MAG: hypothetical protein KA716_19990 [Gloeotrichia echinulata DEX184]
MFKFETGTGDWGLGIGDTSASSVHRWGHFDKLSASLGIGDWGLGTLRQAQCIAGDWGLGIGDTSTSSVHRWGLGTGNWGVMKNDK